MSPASTSYRGELVSLVRKKSELKLNAKSLFLSTDMEEQKVEYAGSKFLHTTEWRGKMSAVLANKLSIFW